MHLQMLILDAAPTGHTQVVSVREGTSYLACDLSRGQVPTTSLPCELGAVAYDKEDGDITPNVLLCPPADCVANSTCGGE
jgi:hypothetical protein